MKKINLIAAASALAMLAVPAYAVTADSDAGAEIIAPLQISNTVALYFGTIAPSLTSADTVVVASNGAKSCGAELTCLTDDHTAAAFAVTGEADQSYSITLPSSVNISNIQVPSLSQWNISNSQRGPASLSLAGPSHLQTQYLNVECRHDQTRLYDSCTPPWSKLIHICPG